SARAASTCWLSPCCPNGQGGECSNPPPGHKRTRQPKLPCQWSSRTLRGLRYPSAALQHHHEDEQQKARNPHQLLDPAVGRCPHAEELLVELQAGIGGQAAEGDAVDQHLAAFLVEVQAELLQTLLARSAI